jgi:hypothetical protein
MNKAENTVKRFFDYCTGAVAARPELRALFAKAALDTEP